VYRSTASVKRRPWHTGQTSIMSTSGRPYRGSRLRTNAVRVSFSWRWASAAIVSNTSDVFPDPETPVNAVIALRSARLVARLDPAPDTGRQQVLWLSPQRGTLPGSTRATKGGLMASRLNPYISFSDNARQAMEFYRDVFGGNLTFNTFGESGGAEGTPEADKIMHAQLETDTGFTLMAADTPPGMPYNPGDNISISLSGDDEDQLRGYWGKLSDGGNVTMPLERQMWGDEFGMCVDRFGVPWMVNIVQQQR
jgi:PhnB protein